MRPYAVAVDGAALPEGSFTPIDLRCDPRATTNAVLRHDEILNAIGRPLRTVESDWLDLLRNIHAADLLCRRGENEDWNRHIVLSMALDEPSVFEPVVPLVQDLFGRMTHDLLDIRLQRRAESLPPTSPKRPLKDKADTVALLSGGLDSASSAARMYADARRTYFISSRQSPHIRSAQKAVVESLSARYGDYGIPLAFEVDLRYTNPEAPLPRADLIPFSPD